MKSFYTIPILIYATNVLSATIEADALKPGALAKRHGRGIGRVVASPSNRMYQRALLALNRGSSDKTERSPDKKEMTPDKQERSPNRRGSSSDQKQGPGVQIPESPSNDWDLAIMTGSPSQ